MTDPQPMQVDMGLVRELASLLDETRLTEIEVEDHGRRVRVVRQPGPAASASAAQPAVAIGALPDAVPAPMPATGTATGSADVAGAVRSPIVGTAYLSPEPTAAAFVAVGENVAEGQTLLIIEAMKVMNPIAAPRAGRVERVLVTDGQPVEYDQPLIVLA